MRRSIILFVLAITLPVRPAAAQTLDDLRRCIAQEVEGANMPNSAYGCIGTLADACQSQPGGDTTVGMIECYGAEARAWDELLNETYKVLSGRLEEREKQALRETQRSWIVYRDRSCEFARSFFQGGTLGGPVGSECMMRKTAEQALWLKGWVDWGN